MNTRSTFGTLGSALMLIAAPAMAASLASTAPAQPIPQPVFDVPGTDTPGAGAGEPPEPFIEESFVTGRTAQVPVVVADATGAQARIGYHAGVTDAHDADTAGGGSVDDLGFVQQAAESGRRELAAARDALPRLQKPGLKRIAGRLVEDHDGFNARLARIAASKGWPMPASETAAPRVPAPGTASADFDEHWTAEMIAGHERSAALYRAQVQGGEDPELRRFARETLPTIEHHLEELRRQQ